ncbi:uncharacterized protein LOC133179822 [Saccostrea echinata]|uniref:uncharacterized protein LOC133179822 n=1 Tax=Saccostrea echinata TaxID=191078 RepID=UPI002A7F2482|nr:uncharacterized protein LOC133179822 [Saccostrea echinata]
MFRVLIHLVSITTVLSVHGKDPSICSGDPVSSVTNRPRPNVTNAFSAHIQCIIMNKNETTDIHEWFDDSQNTGRVRQLAQGIELDAWYSYNTNEFIAYVPGGGCVVQPLSTSNQRFLLGYTASNGGKIFSAAQSLHMSGQGINEIYMGLSSVRGIAVDVWQSCQYWQSMDATMKVFWYFSAANPEWDTAVGVTVPIAARVTGIIYDPGATTGRKFDHWYEMFHYRQTVKDPKVFETPAGVQCPGRKNTKNLPTMPPAFSFMSEYVDKTRKIVSFMKEYYSFTEKMVMYYSRPLPSDMSPYGVNDLREIHDFNTGVAYIIDTMYGNCTVQPIKQTFDTRFVDKNHLRIRNAQEFFYFDVIQYTYEGVKTVRNIDCDSWVGVRANWPSPGVNSTWQWYFASNQWAEVNTGAAQGGTPIQLVIDAPSVAYHNEYNIFNFDVHTPDVLKFDISQCYVNRNRRKFQLTFSGDYKSAVDGNLETFKYNILKSLVSTLSVSAIRIANLNVYYSPTDIIVSFEILDVAPVVGDVQSIVKETPLSVAANTLQTKVQNAQFAIALDKTAFPNIPAMVPIKQSFTETTYLNNKGQTAAAKTGYSPGAMAAVGITLPIVGGALGGVFAYFFFK